MSISIMCSHSRFIIIAIVAMGGIVVIPGIIVLRIHVCCSMALAMVIVFLVVSRIS